MKDNFLTVNYIYISLIFSPQQSANFSYPPKMLCTAWKLIWLKTYLILILIPPPHTHCSNTKNLYIRVFPMTSHNPSACGYNHYYLWKKDKGEERKIFCAVVCFVSLKIPQQVKQKYISGYGTKPAGFENPPLQRSV